jgi:hypothetical protein
MSAPANAAVVDGGVGDQKSSQISAAKTKSARSVASKIRSVPKGTIWPASRGLQPGYARAWREPAILVIFPIVGEETFRHHAEDDAPRDDHSAVVERPVVLHRRANHQHRGE